MPRIRSLLSVMLLPLLSGCVAAALPLLAGGTVAARQAGVRVRAAQQAQPRAAQARVHARGAAATAPGHAPQVTLTHLTELPAPTGAAMQSSRGNDPWQPLVAYSLAQAELDRTAEQPKSALILPQSLLHPIRRPCTARYPAVIIDLDHGRAPFSPRQATEPASGLAEGLARLRGAGIMVVWITQLPQAQVADVAGVLRSSRLDPDGKDPILMIRGRDDRKQVLRDETNKDVCVIALAGDQRSDFDELFDYLRDPASAMGLDDMLGNGWFLVPQPLAAPS